MAFSSFFDKKAVKIPCIIKFWIISSKKIRAYYQKFEYTGCFYSFLVFFRQKSCKNTLYTQIFNNRREKNSLIVCYTPRKSFVIAGFSL